MNDFNPLPKTWNQWADWWEFFAYFYVTYGLPADLMYLTLRDTGLLVVDISADDFEKGVKHAVSFLNVGGWRKVLEAIIVQNLEPKTDTL